MYTSTSTTSTTTQIPIVPRIAPPATPPEPDDKISETKHSDKYNFDIVIATEGKYSGFSQHFSREGEYPSHQQTTMILKYVVGTCLENDILHPSLSKLSKQQVFLDVGANSGFFGLVALSLGCRTIFVEFEPELASRLKRSVTLPSNNFQNSATIINQAISNTAGNIAHVKRLDWGGLTYMKEEKVNQNTISATMNKDESTTTTISTILSNRVKYDDGALVAIKIDVEGAEIKALQGALPLLRKLWLQQESEKKQDNAGQQKTILPDITCEIGPLTRWEKQGQTMEDAVKLLKELVNDLNYRLFLLRDPWHHETFDTFYHQKYKRSDKYGSFWIGSKKNVINKEYAKVFTMSNDIGEVLEITDPERLVVELFTKENDFNIWLSHRDLANELVPKKAV